MCYKGLRGLILGTVAGAAVGMLLMPQLDRKTQRSVKKTGRVIKCVAEGAYDNIMGIMK